jgi:2',3'-cyclic-nucleotide 2'-phosphodiesterase/3'-nucleotidase
MFATTSAISRRTFLAGSAAAGAVVMLHPFSARAQANQAHLRIMETTDLHVHVFPYDYYGDKPNDTMGLARTASIIEAIRAEATNAMLVDNGDFLQGNPMGDYIAYERGMKAGDIHPIIAGMNVLGYDASTLGNHEFNYGLDFMMNTIAGANFPVVCANVTKGQLAGNARGDDLFLKPYVILDKTVTDGAGQPNIPIKVGLIGFVPPQIMNWDSRHLVGKAATRDIVKAAQAWVPQMKEEGADIVIALSHSGMGTPMGYEENLENASILLAGIDGIDAIVTGHSHLDFPGPKFDGVEGRRQRGRYDRRQAGRDGWLLGLASRPASTCCWSATAIAGGWSSSTSEARPISQRVDGKTDALVESKAEVEDAAKRRPRGDAGLCAHAGRQDVRPAAFLFRAGGRRSFGAGREPGAGLVHHRHAEGDGVCKDLPVLSAAAPFKAGGRGGPDYYTDVPPGDVAIKNVADLYLYPNTVQAVVITGAQVKEWLEMSAGIFNQIETGKADQPLINPGFPVLQFRRDRRRDLQDRPVEAGEI